MQEKINKKLEEEVRKKQELIQAHTRQQEANQEFKRKRMQELAEKKKEFRQKEGIVHK